uniref:Uncharacterized protein n=1 Tax=viral metagenome TaxID=1070528 RepID=A0A6C0BUI8_9ZZZZ
MFFFSIIKKKYVALRQLYQHIFFLNYRKEKYFKKTKKPQIP